MKYFFQSLASCISLLHFCANVCSAQKVDLIDQSALLVFNSNQEEYYFNRGDQSTSIDLVMLLMHSESTDIRQIAYDSTYLTTKISALQQLQLPKKKYKKYMQELYDRVHGDFLRRYKDFAPISDMFSDGIYNCVTACVLYATIFDHLSIPYSIKETPNHVYIIARPQGEEYLIETTNPAAGMNGLSEAYQQRFVQVLIENKMITQAEWQINGTQSIFDEYYYKAEDIDLTQLVALHYFNTGLKLLEEEDYKNAYFSLDKANELHSNEKISYILYNVGVQQIAEHNYEDQYYIELLPKISKSDHAVNNELLGEFGRITNKYLVNDNMPMIYDSIYHFLRNGFDRKELIEDIDFVYHFERGRIALVRDKSKVAKQHLKEAYIMEPNNIDVENMLVAAVANSLSGEDETTVVLEELNSYLDINKDFLSNKSFGSMYITAHLLGMYNSFENRDVESAKHHKNQFEELYGVYPTYNIDQVLVGRAYSRASIYYFKRGDYSTAKRMLNSGLKYAPDNIELRNRLYSLGN
ncbi:MAG: hypothetical protein AAGC88_14710 [Bacteroidota bacterium]